MHFQVASPLAVIHRTVRWSEHKAGGHARLRVIATFAAIIALDGADKGTVSATASNIRDAFSVSNTDIGVLLTTVSLVSAALSVPMGILVDRRRRITLLVMSIVGWAVAMVFAAISQSFLWLLLSRVGLGVVAAVTGPAVASMIGDLFATGERARVYGQILAGELVGTGAGLVGSTLVAGTLGWRYAFWWLVPPTLALAWVVSRLDEPPRGQRAVLRSTSSRRASRPEDDTVLRALKQHDIAPREENILTEDAVRMNIWQAVRYVLSVPTNRVLIVASALGYFFFAGVRGFAIEYSQDHYGITKATASGLMIIIGAGALVGVLVGGRLADTLVRRGVIAGRVWVPVVALFTLPILFGPALWTTQVAIGLPLLVVGAAVLSAANPPQDAARLDIMHPRLWGRSESIRTVARTALEGAAPVLFGFTSTSLAGGGHGGLEYTFLIFLISLPLAGAFGLLAVRSYPRDVATAQASIENVPDEPEVESA